MPIYIHSSESSQKKTSAKTSIKDDSSLKRSVVASPPPKISTPKNNLDTSDYDYNDLTQLKLKGQHIERLIVLWRSSCDMLSRLPKPDPKNKAMFSKKTMEKRQHHKDTISSREADIVDELNDIKKSNKTFYTNFLKNHPSTAEIKIGSDEIDVKKQ